MAMIPATEAKALTEKKTVEKAKLDERLKALGKEIEKAAKAGSTSYDMPLTDENFDDLVTTIREFGYTATPDYSEEGQPKLVISW